MTRGGFYSGLTHRLISLEVILSGRPVALQSHNRVESNRPLQNLYNFHPKVDTLMPAAVCVSAISVVLAPSPEAAKVTQLISKDLANLPGKGGLMIRVEYPPGLQTLYIPTTRVRWSMCWKARS